MGNCMHCSKQRDSGGASSSYAETSRQLVHFSSNLTADDSALIPGLPDDLAVLCLARVPRRHHHILKRVCKKWREFMLSELLCSCRQMLGVTESWVYVLCRENCEYVHCYVLDPLYRTWKELPGIPEVCLRRYGMTCEVLGRKLYLIGGCGKFEDATNQVHCYDPLLDKWKEVAYMETPRCHFVCEALNGHLYAIGGMGSTSGALISWEIYDSQANVWTSHENPNIVPDLGQSLVLDGRIYVRHVSPNIYLPTSAAAYDPSNNVWSTVDDDMTRKWHGPAIAVGDDVYMLDQTLGVNLMMLDKENRRWVSVGWLSPLSIMPPCRIAAVGNMLFVIGRGLKTMIFEMEKAGKVRGIWTSIPGVGSCDDVIISCKTITI